MQNADDAEHGEKTVGTWAARRAPTGKIATAIRVASEDSMRTHAIQVNQVAKRARLDFLVNVQDCRASEVAAKNPIMPPVPLGKTWPSEWQACDSRTA